MTFVTGLITRKAAASLLAPLLLAGGIAAFAAGGVAVLTHEHKAPWGLAAKLSRANGVAVAWKANAEAWRAYGEAEKAAFEEQRDLRAREGEDARADVDALSRTCAARVAEARRSSAAIRNIVTKEPPRDPVSHCPLPEPIPFDELRDALQAAAAAGRGPSGPEGLPALRLRGHPDA